MNSAPTTAASGWVWKLSAAQGGSAGSGDSRARLGHAVATNSRRNVSAPGAGSLAATVSPRAKNTAVQLAPIVPVPIAATRVILSPAMSVSSLPRIWKDNRHASFLHDAETSVIRARQNE